MKKSWLAVIAVAIAIAILPTGDPTDIFITMPLLNAIGFKAFLFLALFAIILYEEAK